MEWLKEWLEGSVAFYAAIVATAALALEIRRWLESGVRLALSVMPEAELYGGNFTQEQRQETYIGLTVMNRGDAPTTVTHMVLHNYENSWAKFRKKPKNTGVVPDPGFHSRQHLPFLLEPGKMFHGLVKYNGSLEKWVDAGYLYVGVVCSHSDKPMLVHVRKMKPPQSDIKNVAG